MQKVFPQGLKPDASKAVMSELKLRPPKKQTFSATCLAVPKSSVNSGVSTPEVIVTISQDIYEMT